MRVPLVFLTSVLLVILSISHSHSVSAVTIPTRTYPDAGCMGIPINGSIDDTTCNIANTTHHYRVACSADGLTFNITYYDNNNENTSCTPTTFQPIQEIIYTNGTCYNSTIQYDCPIQTTTNTTIAPNSTETPTATSTPTATEPPTTPTPTPTPTPIATEPPTTPTPTTPTPTTSPNNTGSPNSTSAPTATPTTPSPDPLPPKYTGGYVGIFYNLSVKADLKQKFYSTNTLGTAAPNSSHLEQYDHVTIHFQPNQTDLNEYNPRFGQKQSVHILGYAMDEHGQAILVSVDGPNAIQSTNSFPHVTISVSNSPGYSAVYSNDLWARIAASGYVNITYDGFGKPSALAWNTAVVNASQIMNNTYQFTLPEFIGQYNNYTSTLVKVTLYKPSIGGLEGIFCASKQWNQTSGICDTTPIIVDPTATPSPTTESPTTVSPTTTSPNATTSPNTTASPTTTPATSIPTAAIPTFQLSIRVYANADCSGDATSASAITNGICDGSNAVNESHVITCSSDGLRATDQKYISVGTTKTCSPTQLASTRIWSAGICQQNPDTKQYFRIDCPITESYATSSYPDEKSNIGKVVGWSIGIVIGVCLLTSLLTYLFRDRLSGGNGNGIPLKTDNAGNIIQMQVMEKNTNSVVP